MHKCQCGREFAAPQGLGYHKNFCGRNKISLDRGYEIRVNEVGKIVYIHREILEQKLGRKLKPGEISHHIDENKLNNDPDNLELKTKSSHAKHHSDSERIKLIPRARGSRTRSAKLNEEQVRTIKIRIKNGEKNRSICNDYPVQIDMIQSIRRGKDWKHVKI